MKLTAILLAFTLFALAYRLTPASESSAPEQRVDTASAVSAAGDKRDTARWLRQSGGTWNVCAEWSVEIFNHREQGEKKESQTLTLESGGQLRRLVKRDNIEGIETDCGQACKCKVWQTRTVCTEEDELYAWNESTQKAERIAFKRWYVTQANESLFSICKKLDIPIERFAVLYHLNPGIQKLDKLPDGMKLLIEKSPR